MRKFVGGACVKFESIEKVNSGKYTHSYLAHYLTKSGKKKAYEMVSRNGNIQTQFELYGNSPDAVVVFALNRDHTKIMINREYRMTIGNFVYNLPAGLIDNGETAIEAGRRELHEETGLNVCKDLDILLPSYSAIGISNEKIVIYVCEAEGEISTKENEDCEEIEPLWVTKEDALKILEDNETLCASRTQMILYMWAKGI